MEGNFSTEWNMEGNFSMEWNMEWKIFGKKWKWSGRKLPVWNMEKSSSIPYYALLAGIATLRYAEKLLAIKNAENKYVITATCCSVTSPPHQG